MNLTNIIPQNRQAFVICLALLAVYVSSRPKRPSVEKVNKNLPIDENKVISAANGERSVRTGVLAGIKSRTF